MADLEDVFNKYCAFGGGKDAVAEMDNAKFAKLCRDSFNDKKFTGTDADLIFTKTKAPGARKIRFTEFRDKALPQIAAKKGIDVDSLVEKLCGSAGPSSSGTKADAVKFHDDKSLYTGVYARGGPTNVDKDKLSLAGIVSDHNALTCDVRGVVHK
jgi:hypothetical protein